ncbi:methylenetetrahydrofolate reductase [NAD(P)H] [Persicobacter psychrovividus]|uniref:Methylenetetrahydrofolate reductase n=1 Tax=Persicobacter psychrovividus TaxID=387638 RepID=A0ABN6L4E8_9BACT|nr:5,10-methylenetetrahydrofolate reductase [Persicobacter psychrovividus]
MKIQKIFEKKSKTFSFEFFPPKSTRANIEFGINLGQLLRLSPDFVSVTYGAGGSHQEATFDLVDYIQNKHELTTMVHYTCVGADEQKIKTDLDYLQGIGIENFMLLRGDPPKGESSFKIQESGFNNASDLVAYAKTITDATLGVAGYPEKHPEAVDMNSDISYLKNKMEQGGDFIVTQMFFDNDAYFSFVERCRKAGIKARIIPGIMPITNFKQIKRFSSMVNAHIPDEIINAMEPLQDSPDKMYKVGVYLALKQCMELLERGAPGLHFYTLNKSRATVDIFEALPEWLKRS